MHILTVLLGMQSCWAFNFKNPADADKASKAIATALASGSPSSASIHLEDDFGQKANLKLDAISAWQVADLERTLEVQGITELFRARAQVKLQEMAKKDPMLMFGTQAGTIIHPGAKT